MSEQSTLIILSKITIGQVADHELLKKFKGDYEKLREIVAKFNSVCHFRNFSQRIQMHGLAYPNGEPYPNFSFCALDIEDMRIE